MPEYVKFKEMRKTPRLPLKGNIDLTYRCNNNCRHCWLRIPVEAPEKKSELTFDEIKMIVDDARSMGCCHWSISGGEPMLRSDFIEIFDYITSKSVSYSLNTNGTMITPETARLLKKRGNKMVVLYGATPEIHDHITRNPGSFEATMQGIANLRDVGAGFTVQLVPMKDNYHQFNEMIRLAESLSRYWRIGASWLCLSACGDEEKNREIREERLEPKDLIELDTPNLYPEDDIKEGNCHTCLNMKEDTHLFASCIATRRSFHIDPYGQMTFCCFVKDPVLRYDLRKGTFKKCWEEFIPSLEDKIKAGTEYLENCGSCELRRDCRWCPVYGYLEHRRFSAKVEYLCALARKKRNFKQSWQKERRRHYKIAGITIQVESDLPITDTTFHSTFKVFQVNGPGEDTIFIRHHFSLPHLNGRDLGKEVYRKPPWAIYRRENSWLYLGISTDVKNKHIHRVAVFNHDHTRVRIYNDGAHRFQKGGLRSLTLFPTDQILLARVLADKEGCYLHSSGVVLNGKGLLFVGHSEAGKSTIVTMLKSEAEVLCDDRVIVRRAQEKFRIYGTWSHGDVPEVSAESAPLRAIMFLEQAQGNYLVPLRNRKERMRTLCACLIKPFVNDGWWDKMLRLVEEITREIPCYILYFDKSGQVVDLLKHL